MGVGRTSQNRGQLNPQRHMLVQAVVITQSRVTYGARVVCNPACCSAWFDGNELIHVPFH